MATISCRCGSPLNDFNVFLMDALDAPDDIAASAAALAFKNCVRRESSRQTFLWEIFALKSESLSPELALQKNSAVRILTVHY